MSLHSVTLGDLCAVTASPSSDLFTELAYDVDGTPVVTPADIGDSQRIDPEALRQVPATITGLKRFRLRSGDLVIVRLGGVGRVALVDEATDGCVYHSSCIRIRPDSKRVDPVYLAAYLAHPPVVAELLSYVQMVTVPVLTTQSLERLPILLPDARRQRIMAEALGEVGLQMDLQRRILARLSAVRQGLFTQMLGDGLPGATVSRAKGAVPERNVPRTRRTSRMS
ncbi:restriction endonuclease subunit S [Streptomyces sp. NPDC006284]|uniref:restriction endonuclease subunit S n=1 Tax=Streptomyces sp. NPDC006284 TaxID=3156742 RepID=UPI0033A0714F